jgi:GT2 family glycosyltransferase
LLAPAFEEAGRFLLRLFRALRHPRRSLGRALQRWRERRQAPTASSGYPRWLAENEVAQSAAADAILCQWSVLPTQPLVSVVMPVFNPEPDYLRQAIESVRLQSYPHWELCIADDASTRPEVRRLIASFLERDDRIKVVWRTENGHISAASNSALDLASGEFVVLLDQDDLLAKNALLWVVDAFVRNPAAGAVYSDEDKLGDDGVPVLPFFKPDWSPHLLFSQCYVGHLLAFRRRLAMEIGGFRAGLEGAQDYDLVLRLGAATPVVHVPRVLYHWRLHEHSTALRSDAKPYAHEAGRRALSDALRARYGSQFLRVDDGDFLFTYAPRFRIPTGLKISIIIPTRDKVDYLSRCIASIVEKSTYQNIEIIVIDNNSMEADTFRYFERIQAQDPRVRVLSAPIPFNWSRLNNLGATAASGEVLLFLNNDTTVISPDWLERLAEWSLLPEVASVGALLFYEDGAIQHSGVVVGMNGWADHVFKGMRPVHHASPFVSPLITRNVLAVTGACLAVERGKFYRLGGFDESFVICGSDVEFGIRAYKQGLFNLLCAQARLYHYESKTRDAYIPEGDFVQSEKKYAPYRGDQVDPFFNRNLDPMSVRPTIRSN